MNDAYSGDTTRTYCSFANGSAIELEISRGRISAGLRGSRTLGSGGARCWGGGLPNGVASLYDEALVNVRVAKRGIK